MPDTKGLGTFVTDQFELATDSIDLFSLPNFETSIVHGKSIIYYPTSPLTDDGTYEFIMANDSNEYTMLDRTTIYGEIEVLKSADNSAIAAGDNVTCVNMLPQALFKQIEVYLNGQLINDISTPTYSWKAFWETHFSFDTNLKETTLAATEMYVKDTLEEETNVATSITKDTSGMKKRSGLITGKRIYFDIIPHVDFLRCTKYLIPGVEMRVRLIRNDDNFGLMHTQAKGTYKIKLHKLQLCTRKVTLDPRVSTAIEKSLEKSPSIYSITQSKLKTHLLTSGTQSSYLSQVVRGKLPKSFSFGILESDQMENDPKLNPFYFNHRGLNYLNVFINGEPIHPIAISPDFTKGEFLKEYRWSLDNSGLKQDQTNGITMAEFGSNSCVWHYDLSPDQCNSYFKHGMETGTIDIHIGFKNALTKNYTLLFYGSYDEQVLIDKNRLITVVT